MLLSFLFFSFLYVAKSVFRFCLLLFYIIFLCNHLLLGMIVTIFFLYRSVCGPVMAHIISSPLEGHFSVDLTYHCSAL